MPFQRPTLKELRDRAVADLDSRLSGSDARLRRSNTNVLATVHAGAVHGLHGHLKYIADQIIPDTAEKAYLDRWASIWKIPRKEPESAAGPVIFNGTDGTLIAAGTSLQRSDGALYTVDSDVLIAGGSTSASVTALEPGESGDSASGSSLSLVNPISGVNPAATVGPAGISGGADQEKDDDLRARLLLAIRNPAHGGADFDYVNWALEIPEVTRAWCYPNYWGGGTVGVAIVCDDQAGSIIPDPATVAATQLHIDALRPVTADVTVWAPIEKPLDLTLHLNPDTALIRAAVQAELQDLITREAVPNGTILLSHIREAISIAAGENDHTLTVPAADVVCLGGEISILGAITWA